MSRRNRQTSLSVREVEPGATRIKPTDPSRKKGKRESTLRQTLPFGLYIETLWKYAIHAMSPELTVKPSVMPGTEQWHR